ncbi:MAG: ASPIC/UnbV domain-containing protein, partial [Thermoanaerobaculia bacterium]|nr:ASPIC/UnbV domain-containing protein [Thermoanaerobaculia bacterium]
DNDGDADLAVSENGGPLAFLRAEGAPRRWLGVSLAGAAPNTQGVGAAAALTAGGRRQVTWAAAGDSYQSSSDPRLLFRWAEGEAAEELTVVWPGGSTRRLVDPPAGVYLRLFETVGESAARGSGLE